MAVSGSRLLAFEGLRGIAAMVVVLHHLWLLFFPGSAAALRAMCAPLGAPFDTVLPALGLVWVDGDLAVAVFFTLSGCVLALKCLQLHQQGRSNAARSLAVAGAVRRYPRLVLPVVVSVIFAWALHAAGLMQLDGLARATDRSNNPWLSSFYQFEPMFLEALRGALWDTFVDFDEVTTYNPVLWTMEKELFGSFFVFGFLGCLGANRWRGVGYLLSALVSLWLGSYWLTSFVLGMVLAEIVVYWPDLTQRLTRTLRPPWLTTVLAGMLYVLIGLPNYAGVADIPLAFATCLAVLLLAPLARLLSGPRMVFLGRISFGVYLLHFPLCCSLGCAVYLLYLDVLGTTGAALLASAVCLIGSVVLGRALYLIADRPAIVGSRRIALALG